MRLFFAVSIILSPDEILHITGFNFINAGGYRVVENPG